MLTYVKGYAGAVLAADLVVLVIRFLPIKWHADQLVGLSTLLFLALLLSIVIAIVAAILFLVVVSLASRWKFSHWSYFAVCGALVGVLAGPIGRFFPGSALDDGPAETGLKNYLEGLIIAGPIFALAGFIAGLTYWFVGGRMIFRRNRT